MLKGQILFDNEDISNISSFSIREKITKVSQEIFLFPGTLRENLLLANQNVKEEELNEAIRIANLENYIASLPNGLDTEIGEAGKLMSGGERQRLSLVQGLIRGNKTLLLDEMTANLDSESENIIKNNLKDLVKSKGYTIISISHNDDFLTDSDIVYDLDNEFK